jgi:hypothetical protein
VTVRVCFTTVGVTVKLVALVAVPPASTTVIGPVVAPVGTVAVICVAELVTGATAAIPLNFTDVTVTKPVPVMTTLVPTGPLVGVNDVMLVAAAPTVKLVALVAVPPESTTVIGPVVAPVGTIAVMDVAELVTGETAATPLNLTDVTPTKPVPVMATLVPTGPLVGVNDVMLVVPVTVKSVVLTPGGGDGVVTVILPFVAAGGTVAVICVFELTVKLVADVVLNFTSVALQKFVPVMTTDDPTAPVVGANDVTVGAAEAVTVKSSAAVFALAAPLFTMTSPRPLVAAHGTDEVIEVSLTTVNVAAAPLIITDVTIGVMKLVPVMVTAVPRGPVFGATPVTVGTAAQAGSADTSTPTTPSVSANAIARAEIFLLWDLKSGSPFLTLGVFRGRHEPFSRRPFRRFRSMASLKHPTRIERLITVPMLDRVRNVTHSVDDGPQPFIQSARLTSDARCSRSSRYRSRRSRARSSAIEPDRCHVDRGSTSGTYRRCESRSSLSNASCLHGTVR